MFGKIGRPVEIDTPNSRLMLSLLMSLALPFDGTAVKDQTPPAHSSLLKGPAPRVIYSWRFPNGCQGELYALAKIEERQPFGKASRGADAWKSVMSVLSAGSDDCEVRFRIDGRHPGNVMIKRRLIILNDTHPVYPKVANSQGADKQNGIGDRAGQQVSDFAKMPDLVQFGVIHLGCLKRICSISPDV